MITFAKTLWALISPAYRAKIEKQYGWAMAFHACNHLIIRGGYDKGDIAAGRLLNSKMRELL